MTGSGTLDEQVNWNGSIERANQLGFARVGEKIICDGFG